MKHGIKMRMGVAGVVASVLGAGTALAGEGSPRQVSVSGHCVRTVIPDRGALVLTVDVLEKELKNATRQAAQSYDRLKQSIEKLSLADLNLTTSEYSVREDRQWEKDRAVFKGFRARLGLRVVTSSIDKLGEVISIASREGVQDVGALQTFLSEEKRLKEQMECLKQAAENARAKAERLAGSLGAKVGEVLRVSEQGAGGQVPLPRHEMMMAMDGAPMAKSAPAPSVAAGTQTLELDVDVSFLLK
jgi:uncharacterized protein